MFLGRFWETAQDAPGRCQDASRRLQASILKRFWMLLDNFVKISRGFWEDFRVMVDAFGPEFSIFFVCFKTTQYLLKTHPKTHPIHLQDAPQTQPRRIQRVDYMEMLVRLLLLWWLLHWGWKILGGFSGNSQDLLKTVQDGPGRCQDASECLWASILFE